MSQPDAAVLRIIRAYSAATTATRNHVVAFTGDSWRSLGSWYDGDVDQWVAQVVPVVKGGQRHIASMTDAYLAHIAAETTGQPVRPLGVPAAVIDEVRGVNLLDVYRRAGVELWTALSNGVALDAAVLLGLTRAQSLAATDLQLAKTHTSRYILSRRDGVTGYRRVLNSGNPCDLCAEASDQTYGREDLMPIHPGCDCGVEPILDSHDPGEVDASASTAVAVDLTVHEHGELGPLLGVAGQSFTGPDDI